MLEAIWRPESEGNGGLDAAEAHKLSSEKVLRLEFVPLGSERARYWATVAPQEVALMA